VNNLLIYECEKNKKRMLNENKKNEEEKERD
jgi:hypothetical protein